MAARTATAEDAPTVRRRPCLAGHPQSGADASAMPSAARAAAARSGRAPFAGDGQHSTATVIEARIPRTRQTRRSAACGGARVPSPSGPAPQRHRRTAPPAWEQPRGRGAAEGDLGVSRRPAARRHGCPPPQRGDVAGEREQPRIRRADDPGWIASTARRMAWRRTSAAARRGPHAATSAAAIAAGTAARRGGAKVERGKREVLGGHHNEYPEPGLPASGISPALGAATRTRGYGREGRGRATSRVLSGK